MDEALWTTFSGIDRRILFTAIAMHGVLCGRADGNLVFNADQIVEMADALICSLDKKELAENEGEKECNS